MNLKKNRPPFYGQFFKSTLCVLVFYFFTTSLFSQNTFQTYVSLDYGNQPLESILKDLQERYDIVFSYSNLDLSKKESFKFKGTLESGLRKLLAESYIEFKIIDNHVILKFGPPKGRKIKGQIVDVDTKVPLVGATVAVLNSDPLIGVNTDIDGYFEIEKLPIGRYDILAQYLGYESNTASQILTSSGKEIFLNIELRESTLSFQEVIVTAQTENSDPLNEFATASSRSFSVEETRRFAASISDPARMVQSYAGISSGGDDLSNEIIIRGNSTRGLLWKIEGVEVPNPNHFGGLGNGGGAISMLSSSMLTNFDFYTGAFPAEYGNALSGVFDMRIRNGNTDKREHSLTIGNLGVEASTEGYFKKGEKASYLVNFRYSTVETFLRFLPDLEQRVPAYRDLSFKINMPTERAGNFSIFGLGGKNFSKIEAERDSTKWNILNDALDFFDDEKVGVIGVTHRLLVSDNAYFKTSLAKTYYAYNDLTNFLNADLNYQDSTIDESRFRNGDLAVNFSFHQKINAKNKIRTGFSISQESFSYDYRTIPDDGDLGDFEMFLKNNGSTQYLQSYVQWQKRIDEKWEINLGFNFSYLTLNKTYALDPRAAIQWKINPRNKIAFSLGLHSKPEHVSTYFIERINLNGTLNSPNLNLDISRALHVILGYEFQFPGNVKFKAEAYYQYLYNIPVSENPENGFSVLNVVDVFDIIYGNDRGQSALVSEGTGINYGVDLTFEKPFSDGYYFLITSSIYDSKYSTRDGKTYHAATANNYILNLLGGKEWKVGKKKKNIFGANTKFTYYGGRRDTPIDLNASIKDGGTVYTTGQFFSDRVAAYFRWDIGVGYKINTLKQTHSFRLDIQNVTNRFNIYRRFYSEFSQVIIEDTQNGLIPFIVYRVEF